MVQHVKINQSYKILFVLIIINITKIVDKNARASDDTNAALTL